MPAIRAKPFFHSYGAREEHVLQDITRVTRENNPSLWVGYLRGLDTYRRGVRTAVISVPPTQDPDFQCRLNRLFVQAGSNRKGCGV
jgi:hypothetical protein